MLLPNEIADQFIKLIISKEFTEMWFWNVEAHFSFRTVGGWSFQREIIIDPECGDEDDGYRPRKIVYVHV